MENRTFVEWDKDDIDALGILKVDVLALGMLTCIRKCFDLIAEHGGPKLTLATVPADDPGVYDMLCAADSLGVFQVESRAQMNMLPRLRPRTFYDLVIEVAIVRPGPIQGDMVHPYLRRRKGLEEVSFPSPHPDHGPPDELERVLGKTLGVPLFQEQAMRIAIDAAKFTADEANGLRRAMATFRRNGAIHTFEEKLITGMTRRGYDEDFARRCFDQIKGFGDYGFPESHSASFSLLVYVSSWIKRWRPAAFACGLLNSQPMGFYAPAQIVRDAREHGVEVRPVDINHSDWDCTLETADGAKIEQQQPPHRQTPEDEMRALVAETARKNGVALRLGLRLVDGLFEEPARALIAARNVGNGASFTDVDDVRRRARIPRAALEKIAAADGFRSLGLDRRQALWAIRGLPRDEPLALFIHADTADTGSEPDANLPIMPLPEHVVQDYETLRLSLKAHPLSFLRPLYDRENVSTARAATGMKSGAPVTVAGVVLIRQRPGTASGVVFMTLEDETGVINVIIWPKVMEKFRKTVMGARLVHVRGRMQAQDNVTHLIANHLENRTDDLDLLSEDTLIEQLGRRGEVVTSARQAVTWRHPRNVRVLPKSRDFH